MTGPRFLIRKSRSALVRLGASKALSRRAMLRIIRIGQRITLLVIVKKKIVLAGIRKSQPSFRRGGYHESRDHLRLGLVVSSFVMDKLHCHG